MLFLWNKINHLKCFLKLNNQTTLTHSFQSLTTHHSSTPYYSSSTSTPHHFSSSSTPLHSFMLSPPTSDDDDLLILEDLGVSIPLTLFTSPPDAAKLWTPNNADTPLVRNRAAFTPLALDRAPSYSNQYKPEQYSFSPSTWLKVCSMFKAILKLLVFSLFMYLLWVCTVRFLRSLDSFYLNVWCIHSEWSTWLVIL